MAQMRLPQAQDFFGCFPLGDIYASGYPGHHVALTIPNRGGAHHDGGLAVVLPDEGDFFAQHHFAGGQGPLQRPFFQTVRPPVLMHDPHLGKTMVNVNGQLRKPPDVLQSTVSKNELARRGLYDGDPGGHLLHHRIEKGFFSL